MTTRVLANQEDAGLSGARNTGVLAAAADIVAFLDDDAVADPTWLAELTAHFGDPRVVGAGGRIVPAWKRHEPSWFPPEFRWVVGCSYEGLPKTAADVRNPIGASMAFRRQSALDAGGFSTGIGRIGTTPLGCEETELSIRLAAQQRDARIVYEPRSVVHHEVGPERARWSYFSRRCWAEGLSKAQVARLSGPRSALATERGYALQTLPRGMVRDLREARAAKSAAPLARVAASVAGLAITAAGYAVGTARSRHTPDMNPPETGGVSPQKQQKKRVTTMTDWLQDPELNFDLHGLLGIRVDATAPTADQMRTMLSCFATTQEVPPDIIISERSEPMPDAALLEHELAYTENAVRFVDDRVQIIAEGNQYRIHGSGELLTSLVPVLDRAMVSRGAAMIHAATMAFDGHAIALPAAGGTGKTSAAAKLMRREGWSFMGDDWAFLADDGTLLGYEKPMFIKPHHKAIYPHLFAGARKPLVPQRMSRAVGKLTTVVHPHVVRYPKLAHMARRWSPEHRMVDARRAFPGREPTRSAPLAAAIYIERFEGARARLLQRDTDWMVDRMIGNFHVEMATFSQQVVTGLAATNVIPWRNHVSDKADILTKALDGRPCHLLQVPSVYSADEASDVMVKLLSEHVPAVLAATD